MSVVDVDIENLYGKEKGSLLEYSIEENRNLQKKTVIFNHTC